ncbi:orotidine-5'-phosphate decarboxylase [Micromonospora aurantiaca]|uniref:orotidine-5'-phosphate decarboxylase n=1 Tax=Micromonospora aurantiaca (nom. illeg.) TaxID=47850 RepID=UPI0033ABBAE1
MTSSNATPSLSKDRLCLALDMSDRTAILGAVDELRDLVGYFKLNSAFTLFGPELVRDILDRGVKVFLDLKLHDIPNTLTGYGRAVTELGVHLVTVHSAGGIEMMRALVSAADEAARDLGRDRPRIVGVTLLTSVDQDLLNNELNIPGTVQDEIRHRAALAAKAGLDGIVCAPTEISQVRDDLPDNFFYVTPGTRSPGEGDRDHRRTGTHAEAVAAGSSLLVIGRRITGASDRRQAAQEVLAEIEAVS